VCADDNQGAGRSDGVESVVAIGLGGIAGPQLVGAAAGTNRRQGELQSARPTNGELDRPP